jgi:hypothetical protein
MCRCSANYFDLTSALLQVGSAASIFFFARACGGLQARSLWALLRPLPGKPFPNGWDFCVEACVPQDRDRFVFGDFVVVIAALLDGLDECDEPLLVDHGLFFWVWMRPRRSGNGARSCFLRSSSSSFFERVSN